ncbi:MAG: hypothetical protein DUD27_03870 [Lachnospiraceae bacterium]|uniref:Uncharacterized protein n=1 Tax=Candidatus Weimeria bifida TaxID=2599074 RepID=A0A6N7J2P0_9FIRM|nr:hypothetical protein [Candidatus Weimeria bifida]RRF96485.1 MAG: hypothetical protein DUD27_03870 [Lachnospiraceae bacterium]
METVFKSFSGLFFFLMITSLGISLIASSIQASNANRALLGYVEEIENSNYSDDVIAACRNDAKVQFGEGKDALEVVKAAQNGKRQVSYARATLKYHFRIPFIGYDTTHSVSSVMT